MEMFVLLLCVNELHNNNKRSNAKTSTTKQQEIQQYTNKATKNQHKYIFF